ncbi:winged helix-turn-helix transcriptional regulator [Sinomicrobium weinanense]|uniref:Helix-turn-helix transcriptional regulator n=1 Tax=Sinomicrobium weinanense TaxID=2842200 RepID=A0A926Q2Q9_9FLAO|nr:helix-turn-helix domain-containing protein [Sinomicrobium weinanense]MBC9794935.1 helix-turn-helix transcriptional regulator [Sinomicrobium weinanense]MBU3125706.1 helix-turn-helix transcriptional regulator [Sinomicrobium weinanense]
MEKVSKETCKKRLKGIDDALYAIGGKWKLKIIIALIEGYTRFNEMQRTIGISAKMLSLELKELELNGFLTREVHPGPPVVVEYKVTEYSDSLQEVLQVLSNWGEKHREKIRQERSGK